MKNLIQAAVVTLFAASTAQAQQAVQWKVSDGGNGHWYQWAVQPSGLSWTAARERCVARGGHLATPTEPGENQFIFNLTLPTSAWLNRFGPWLGGYQDPAAPAYSEPAGGWRWVTDEQWAWTAWWQGEPSNFYCVAPGEDKLHFIDFQPKWNDITNEAGECEGSNWSYLVEWDTDCNNDGIVDYGQCHDGTLPDYNGNNVPDCCEGSTPCVIGSYPVQWRMADGGNDHWYQLRRRASVVSWSSAREECLALGGDLASILSEAEDKFVFGVADRPGAWQGYLGPWLGGLQVPGTGEPLGIWRWSSGEPWGYVGPDSSFPNNGGPPGTDENRLHYIDFVRKWNDLPEGGCPENGGGVRALVAEWSADCNHDGIVDYGQILAGQLADLNHDGIPDACQQPTCHDADLYPSGRIDGADLAGLLSEWGPANANTRADIDHDGKVDGADLAILLSFWGPCQN